MVERIPLFPIDIFKIRARNHDKIKKHLMDTVYPEYLKRGPNDPIQNTFTDYGFTADAAYCHWPLLYELYRPDIYLMLEEIGVNFKDPWKISMKGWYNFTTENTREFIHDHTGGPSTIQFSAVHYVNLEKNSKPTVFVNPCQRQMKSIIPTKNHDHMPEYFYNFKRFPTAEEGDIVLFPSWIDHYVPNHSNGELRVTTALNIMMRVDNGDGN
jgi:hypothetical protein